MRLAPLLLIAALGAALPRIADAQSPASVQLFNDGRRLRDAHDWPGAIRAFEASLAASPTIGAYYNLGFCREQTGELAAAHEAYAAAARLAKQLGDPRRQEAEAAAARLLPGLHWVRLETPEELVGRDDATITVDGKEIAKDARGAEIITGAPTHTVVVHAPGREPWTRAEIADHASVMLALGPPRAAAPVPVAPAPPSPAPSEPRTPPAPPAAADDRGGTQRMIGLGVGGAGIATLAVSGVLFVVGHGHLGDLADARGAACASGRGPECTAADAHAHDYKDSIATSTTVLDVVGAVLVLGGGALWLTAPRGAGGVGVRIAPAVGANGGMLRLVGELP